MSDCIHHWRQEVGDVHAPFECVNCGEVKVLETDFYKLFEARTGRPWARNEERPASATAEIKSVGPLAA